VGGAVATLIEYAPAERRGFYSALQQLSQGSAVLATGLVGVAMTNLFSQEQILAGAWRIAFVVGLLIAPVGFYIRSRVDETPAFRAVEAVAARSRIFRLALQHFPSIFLGILVMVLWTVATYVSNYFTTYAVREIHLTLQQSYIGQICYGLTMLAVCPLAGRMSDRVGRLRCLASGALGIGVVAVPSFWLLIHYPSLTSLCIAQVAIAVFLALYASTASTVLGELFPTTVRVTGVSLSYSCGVTLFGGFTPAIVTALLEFSGDKMVIAYYLVGAALFSGIPLLAVRKWRSGGALAAEPEPS
jgi:MHS family proline/betaine transporter-like MFS transporter